MFYSAQLRIDIDGDRFWCESANRATLYRFLRRYDLPYADISMTMRSTPESTIECANKQEVYRVLGWQ